MSKPVTCNGCGKKYTPKPEWRGKTLKCPCGERIKIPKCESKQPPLLSIPFDWSTPGLLLLAAALLGGHGIYATFTNTGTLRILKDPTPLAAAHGFLEGYAIDGPLNLIAALILLAIAAYYYYTPTVMTTRTGLIIQRAPLRRASSIEWADIQGVEDRRFRARLSHNQNEKTSLWWTTLHKPSKQPLLDCIREFAGTPAPKADKRHSESLSRSHAAVTYWRVGLLAVLLLHACTLGTIHAYNHESWPFNSPGSDMVKSIIARSKAETAYETVSLGQRNGKEYKLRRKFHVSTNGRRTLVKETEQLQGIWNDGVEKMYDRHTGKCIRETPYARDVIQGTEWRYDRNGILVMKVPYISGKIQGKVQLYQGENRLLSEQTYVDDLPDGEGKQFGDGATVTDSWVLQDGVHLKAREQLLSLPPRTSTANENWDKSPPYLFPIRIDGKYGYINSSGKLVISARYDAAGEFNEGKATITLNGKAGCIDVSGKSLIPPRYESIGEFSEGLASVKLNGKSGYLDPTGKITIPCKYDSCGKFQEGLAPVGVGEDIKSMKYGFVDRRGKVVIPLIYSSAERFRNGLSLIGKGKSFLDDIDGYINKAGEVVITPQYRVAFRFEEGLAYVMGEDIPSGDHAGFITSDNEFVMRPAHIWPSLVYCNGYVSNGMISVVLKVDGKSLTGYANPKGRMVVKPQFKSGSLFSEGLAFVKLNSPTNTHAVIDRTGTIQFTSKLNFTPYPFRGGLAKLVMHDNNE
ncbi:MAG: WG repeat-containing protein, partial [Planctomycetota bacterium]